MESALKRDLRNYPLYFLIWTIIGIFFLSQALSQKFFSRDPTPWWHYLISWLVGVYLWALLMPAILWLGRRFPIERRGFGGPAQPTIHGSEWMPDMDPRPLLHR